MQYCEKRELPKPYHFCKRQGKYVSKGKIMSKIYQCLHTHESYENESMSVTSIHCTSHSH